MKPKPACADVPTRFFFSDDWQRDKIRHSDALEDARSYCDRCPVRTACLKLAMDYEKGSAVDMRFGVFAGFTPAQRHSLERRRVDWTGADPVKVRHGILAAHGPQMPPIPDRGDQWTPRHTKLAEEVIAWLVENVEPDDQCPTPTALSRKLGVRVNDMRRVYEALLDDRIIEEQGSLFVRRASASATKGWVPPHLRIASMPA